MIKKTIIILLSLVLSIFYSYANDWNIDKDYIIINQSEYFNSVKDLQIGKSLTGKVFQVDYFFAFPACLPCVAYEILGGWSKIPKQFNQSVYINVYSNDKKFCETLSKTVTTNELQNYRVIFVNSEEGIEFINNNSLHCYYSNIQNNYSVRYKLKTDDNYYSSCFRDFDSTIVSQNTALPIDSLKCENTKTINIPKIDDFKLSIHSDGFEIFSKHQLQGYSYDSNFELKKPHLYSPYDYNKKFAKSPVYQLITKAIPFKDKIYSYNIKLTNIMDSVILNERVRTYMGYEHQLAEISFNKDTSDYRLKIIKKFHNGFNVFHLSDKREGIWIEVGHLFKNNKIIPTPHYYFYNKKGKFKTIITDSSFKAPDEDFVSSYNNDLYILLDNGSFSKTSINGDYKRVFDNIYIPDSYRTFTFYDNQNISINYIKNNKTFLTIYNSAGLRQSDEIEIPENSKAYYDSNSGTINLLHQKESDRQWYFSKYILKFE